MESNSYTWPLIVVNVTITIHTSHMGDQFNIDWPRVEPNTFGRFLMINPMYAIMTMAVLDRLL